MFWLHHLCNGELKFSYLKRIYLVTLQTFQMTILLLFEAVDSLTCKELQDNLQLSSDSFQKHVQSLIESKILLTTSENFSDETVISLNMDYSNKRTKFRITAISQKETPQEVSFLLSLYLARNLSLFFFRWSKP